MLANSNLLCKTNGVSSFCLQNARESLYKVQKKGLIGPRQIVVDALIVDLWWLCKMQSHHKSTKSKCEQKLTV